MCTGSGLLTLDVVTNGHGDAGPRFWAGGSCGNVLTILAYLGWISFPIARLGDDPAGETVEADLQRFGVRNDFLYLHGNVRTPIIVEKIYTNRSGLPSHRFEWRCPCCGTWLPQFTPLPKNMVDQALTSIPSTQAFYFDRVAPGILALADEARKRGALVVFEPSSFRMSKAFVRALELAHIVKYSHERLGDVDFIDLASRAELVVETLGSVGLRYSLKLRSDRRTSWSELPAVFVKTLLDAAGSGDWCTAGIIHTLGSEGVAGWENKSESEITEALNLGQALAAVNCSFEGARGAMYSLTRMEVETRVESFVTRNASTDSAVFSELKVHTSSMALVCPGCRKESLNKRSQEI